MSKILIIDIETEPNLSYHWRMFKENIGIDQVVKRGDMLCFAAKWFGNREFEFYSSWDDGYVPMLKQAHRLLSEADAVVTKNGDKFDLAWFLTEFLKYDLPMIPPVTSIDLEKTLRAKFRFLSNKLDWVVQDLGIGKKVNHEGFMLWRKVMDGNPVAQRKMRSYCIGDVRVTERLYKKMRSFIVNHPHLGDTKGRECGSCGSTHVHVSKYRRTKNFKIQQLHCQSCGSYFDGTRNKLT